MVNNAIKLAIEAGWYVFGEEHWVLGFGKHPGEKPERPEQEELFVNAFAERDTLLDNADLWMLIAPGLDDTKKCAVSDFTFFNGGPNLSIVAAFALYDGAIYYWDENARESLILQGGPNGVWFASEKSGALFVDGTASDKGSSQMKQAIRFLSVSEGRAVLRKLQEQNFPLPETWDTAGKVIQFMERL